MKSHHFIPLVVIVILEIVETLVQPDEMPIAPSSSDDDSEVEEEHAKPMYVNVQDTVPQEPEKSSDEVNETEPAPETLSTINEDILSPPTSTEVGSIKQEENDTVENNTKLDEVHEEPNIASTKNEESSSSSSSSDDESDVEEEHATPMYVNVQDTVPIESEQSSPKNDAGSSSDPPTSYAKLITPSGFSAPSAPVSSQEQPEVAEDNHEPDSY